MVFALHNPSDTAIERWISARRYTIIGSGVVWPDLDARRIETITPSIGFMPERIDSERADLFRITLEPGQTITYVAELSSERYARIYLWKPLDYELQVRERQLFNGVMLGLTGLLAIFLTAIFAANHKVIFPAAALVAWCVLGYLCVDFGFFHKLFQLKAENNAVYRAACESAMAASLVIFLYFFLRISLWHGLARMLFSVWIVAQLALVAVAVIDPRLASTFARMSFAAIGSIGMLVTLFLALRGQDRALSLIPTWMLLLVWCFGAAVALTGQLSGDMVVSGLVAGLVLIVLLIGFTVTQFAFRSLEPLYGSSPSELQLRSVAVEAAGAGVWEWSARRDEVKVSGNVEAALGLNPGELNTKVEDFCRHIHPADQERFRLSLVANEERNDGQMHCMFRLRHADNSYRWYEIEASSIPSADGRTMKSVGLLRDVTDSKRSQERLLTDSVKCSLTGLPNRQILADRLAIAMQRARSEMHIRPTVMFVDIDKFKTVNSSYGVVVGDSFLLTVARRLQRHLEPEDTLARAGGDRFAILLMKERSAADLAALAERIRRSLRSPIKLAGQDIVLTGSVGIAIFDGQQSTEQDLLREAETAMYRAKRGGADRIEIFRPEMRGQHDDGTLMEVEIRKAIEKNQIRVLYQPVVYMPMEELAGFEAVVRWEHPKQGLLNPFGYLQWDGAADLLHKIVQAALVRALKDCAFWQKELPRAERALFVNLNLPSGVTLNQELAQDISQNLARQPVAKGSLKIGVAECLVMENPEQATEALEWLRSAGAELILDGFCSGYSSLLYLGRLPFEAVRIDRALLASGGADANGNGMLKAVTALTHELGRKVVVDGVETDEDVSVLRSMDCEYGQGFYYGDPITEREVLQLLKLVRKSERRMQPRSLFRTASRKSGEGETAPQSEKTAPAAQRRRNAASASAPVAPAPVADVPAPATSESMEMPALAGIANEAPAVPAEPKTVPLRRQGRPDRPAVPRPDANGGRADLAIPPGPVAPPPMPAAAAASSPMPPPPAAMRPPPLAAHSGNGHLHPPERSAGERPAELAPLPPLPLVQPAVVPSAPSDPMAPFVMANGLPPEAPAAPPVPGVGSPPPVPAQRTAPPLPPPASKPAPVRPLPNLDKLPPHIAASLQRLAGGAPPGPPLKRVGGSSGGNGGTPASGAAE
jgi:diguanylate cyclase (GGDEF)-like protein/PAS domain S-box-containing protein